MDATLISLISAGTALTASIAGPLVTLRVARWQVNAAVVSANREKWIATLREAIAELIALLTAAVVVRATWRERWKGGLGPPGEDAAWLAKIERITQAQARIRLLLNPMEPDNRQLIEAIEVALKRVRSDDEPDSATASDVRDIIALSQAILKREWERVKRGS